MNGPALKTSLPGPRAKALIERDAQVVSTSYTRDYPLVMARGEGALRRRCRRQRVSRLHRRHRGHLDRPFPSRCREGDHRAGAEVPAHVGDRLLLRAAGAPRRGAVGDRADAGPSPVVLRKLRNRGERSGDQAGPLLHEAPEPHRVLRCVSRPLDGIAVADGEQADAAPRLWTVRPRASSRAVRQLLSLPDRPQP